MKSCPSHCETSATRQSLRKLRRNRIPKRQSPSRFCVQAIAELQPQKSRNVAFGTPKTMKSCPSHCETAATRQSPRKLRRERIRKGRAPAGFASKPLRNCNLKNLETLLLEPLKTMKSCPSHCETAATRQSPRKLRRERIRKGRAPAGFASKPLQECSLKNLETLLLEPLKTMKSSPIKQPAQNNKLRYKNTSRTKHRIRAKSCETARNTLLGALPLSKGSADFNHKQRPRTMPKCCLRNALCQTSKTSVPSLWRTAAE